MKRLFSILLTSSLSLMALAQSITIKKIETPIVLDGVIDEIWSEADSAYGFTQNFPTDSLPASVPSVAKVLYDEENIYVLGVMHNKPNRSGYVTPSLRRDFRGASNDSFSVIFDTFSDRTNAVLFGVNPFGVMREAIITNGGSGGDSFSLDWDNKWYAQARQYDGYWVVKWPYHLKHYALKKMRIPGWSIFTVWIVSMQNVVPGHQSKGYFLFSIWLITV